MIAGGTTLASGCVYRMNIQQGNFLEAKAVDQVKVGMTKDLSGWILGAAVIGGDKKDFFVDTELDAAGKVRPVVSVTKSF